MKGLDIGGQPNRPKQLDLRKLVKSEEKKQTDEPTKSPEKIFADEPEVKKPVTSPAPETPPPIEPPQPTDFWNEEPVKKPDEEIEQLFKDTEPPKEITPISETELPAAPKEKAKPTKKGLSKKWVWGIKAAVTAAIVIALVGSAFFSRAFFTGANIFDQEGTNTLEQIRHLVLSDDNQLIGESDDRINVLLLGMGGEGHDGAMLTDTIIVMSIKPSTGEIAMISLPRDMWIETNEFGYSRINKINYYGEEVDPGNGSVYVRNLVEEITGLDIPYYVRIDFEGFRDIVDSLGGVEIDVENGFKDTEYPGANYGYMTVEFERGPQQMDGEEALQYARSRHGVITDADPESEVTNEASDFARSRRQQKLIAAIKAKAMSTGVMANPQKLNSLFEALDKHLTTNMQLWEGLRLLELTEDYDIENIQVAVISNEEFLKVYITEDGAYTLIPKEGFNEYRQIQEFSLNIFDNGDLATGEEIAIPSEDEELSEEEKAKLEEQAGEESGYEELAEIEEEIVEEEQAELPATVAVQNGTTITGLASKTAGQVRADNYEVITFGNAANQANTTTIIYDNTNGEKSDQLNALAESLGAQTQTGPAPANKNGIKEDADFIIIVGTDIKI
ncbi:LCP family protein [Patescibacteria group bacterium]